MSETMHDKLRRLYQGEQFPPEERRQLLLWEKRRDEARDEREAILLDAYREDYI